MGKTIQEAFQRGYNRIHYEVIQKLTMDRRDFIKSSLMGLGALALSPIPTADKISGLTGLGRITTGSISIYKEPWDKSAILYTRYRDELVNLYAEVKSDKGPDWNPIWYRVWRGYIHSKFVQTVEKRENPTEASVIKEGQLAEITVPFVQSMRPRQNEKWEPLYRLYYGSMHWVIDVVEGQDGTRWYRLQEPWSQLTYDVPAEAMRFVQNEEFSPISAYVLPEDKRIEVSISKQELIAFEKDKAVFQAKVSTGLNHTVPDGEIPWTTPQGEWRISYKMPTQHMGNGNITSEVEAYELAGIPWVCYFHPNGNATHGTFWHSNFGNPMSHGCVNMRSEDARWIFRWSTPVWTPNDRSVKGNGTRIIVTV